MFSLPYNIPVTQTVQILSTNLYVIYVMFLQWISIQLYKYHWVTSFIFFWLLYSAAGDPNAWRLGRIEETDHETPV